MLKYILVFCVISLCDSFPPIREINYDQLLLAQRSPTDAFFAQELKSGKEGIAANDKAIELLRELGPFQARNWIIHGFWAISNRIPFIFCRDITQRYFYMYNESTMNATFKAELSRNWPDLGETRNNSQIWMNAYNRYGYCIETATVPYFEKAMRLLQRSNIGEILTSSRIHPGGIYNFEKIFKSIRKSLRAQPYVTCRSDQNPEADVQYLSEVQVCFNKKSRLMDCNAIVSNLCNPGKRIFYPGSLNCIIYGERNVNLYGIAYFNFIYKYEIFYRKAILNLKIVKDLEIKLECTYIDDCVQRCCITHNWTCQDPHLWCPCLPELLKCPSEKSCEIRLVKECAVKPCHPTYTCV